MNPVSPETLRGRRGICVQREGGFGRTRAAKQTAETKKLKDSPRPVVARLWEGHPGQEPLEGLTKQQGLAGEAGEALRWLRQSSEAEGLGRISGTDAKLKEVFSKGQLPSKRLLHWIAPGPEIPTVDTPLNEVTGGPWTGGYVTWWVTHHHLERANRPRASGRPKGKLGESVKWGLGESEAA